MDINIEKIMDDIRAEIKEKGYTADMLSFNEVSSSVHASESGQFSVEEYNGVVSYLKTAHVVPVSKPITGNPIIVFIKKLIRKFTRVTIRPVVEHQSEYNAFSARALSMVGDYIEQNSVVSNAELLEKIKMLELKLQTAAKEIDRLTARLAEIENKN
ncbi:MAG: hypothetical protein IKB51_06065 [Clostridia bacterium]|nr:hypothetical protein [Clostridia bacterium]